MPLLDDFESDKLKNIDTKSKQGLLFLKKCNIYKNNIIFPEVKVYSKEFIKNTRLILFKWI